SGLVKARWELTPGHRIAGTFIDYQSDFIDRTGTPGRDLVERDTNVENTQYTVGYTFSRPDIPLLDFSAKVYNNRTKLEQTRLTPSYFGPIGEQDGAQRKFDVETTGFDVFNTSRFEFGSTKLAVTYGGDAFEDR